MCVMFCLVYGDCCVLFVMYCFVCGVRCRSVSLVVCWPLRCGLIDARRVFLRKKGLGCKFVGCSVCVG